MTRSRINPFHAAGLRQAAPDIIRFGHGGSRGRKPDRGAFLSSPRVVCLVIDRPHHGR
jgi:hypothetical protein